MSAASAPSGVVTFLFTDVEGSTRRWDADADGMHAALATYDAVLRSAIETLGGWLFKHTGDGVRAASDSPRSAVDAAVAAQRVLELPVWMGVATGEAKLQGSDYFGAVLNRAVRVMAAGHGGQILAESTASLLSGVDLLDLGPRQQRDLPTAVGLFQVRALGLQTEFPPLRALDVTPGNLRPQTASFNGRESEVVEVQAVLRAHRLVTLTGVGGVGKTRLALEVDGHLADEFPGRRMAFRTGCGRRSGRRLRSFTMQLFDDLDDFGSFDDAVSGDVRDPYTELARLRREEPVQRIDMSGMPGEEGKPVFIVYRYEDVQQMLRDNETFSSAIVIQAFGDVLGQDVMLGMDEPEHNRHRALVSKTFSQKALARWEDELIGKVGNELIDGFAEGGRADLVKEFTFPYPTQIIAGLLGLPREDYPDFQRWSISLLSFTINPVRGRAASQALEEYFTPILAARRKEPRDDLISGLAQAQIDSEKLSDEEIFSFLRLLLPAGVETTYRSLGNMLFGLLSDPEQLEAVRADRSLLPQAIEEAVRWEPPVLTITRVATRDTELGGVQIPAGSSVMPMLGAANRQDDRFPDPDHFDIFRERKPHIGFGHGAHVCLGMHLARLEMRVALNLLFDRLPNLRMDPDAKDPHIRGQVFRSPTSLPVLFDAAGR